jgi:hypothetical protein
MEFVILGGSAYDGRVGRSLKTQSAVLTRVEVADIPSPPAVATINARLTLIIGQATSPQLTVGVDTALVGTAEEPRAEASASVPSILKACRLCRLVQ